MISQVRTYFRNRILEIDSDLYEHNDFFNVENTLVESKHKVFHIAYAGLSSDFVNHQNLAEDNLSIELKLICKGHKDTINDFDSFTDLAHRIRINCIATNESKLEEEMLAVGMISMGWDYPVSNDNTLIITMSFSVKMAFQVN